MIIEVKIVLNFIVWKLFDTNPCSQLLKIIDWNFIDIEIIVKKGTQT